MPDQIMLVTGSTDGTGKETARQLAQLGATVIVHGRSVERCAAACNDIRTATGNPHVDFVVADLSSQRQVRHMAAEISTRYDRLHVLINNAGVILLQRQLSEDAMEMSFAVNHLAPLHRLGLVERFIPGARCGFVGLSGDFARSRAGDGEIFREPIGWCASPKAKDVRLRRKFWDVSVELVGLQENRSGVS